MGCQQCTSFYITHKIGPHGWRAGLYSRQVDPNWTRRKGRLHDSHRSVTTAKNSQARSSSPMAGRCWIYWRQAQLMSPRLLAICFSWKRVQVERTGVRAPSTSNHPAGMTWSWTPCPGAALLESLLRFVA